ncbi:hypothetical protein HYN59_03125 [Flavobacterium album]|uniref:tRNA_anti-like n=1 Tax=Flavobacterium album TaxID=2175091 RepID=A0A2S1QUU7_9FLAO|nr:hypothetical protein [Flavobacterium album]AWH84165.1 hypothetical protein HYN59_03125 [Flavobacterium album]
MRKKTIIIVAAVLVIALGAAGFYKGYLYKDARDISSEEAASTLEAGKLVGEYKKDAMAADQKYLNKTIEVKGKVTGVSDSVATIDSVVVCGFDMLPKKKSTGKAVTIKGRCIGYDELFGEVKLDQCTIKE